MRDALTGQAIKKQDKPTTKMVAKCGQTRAEQRGAIARIILRSWATLTTCIWRSKAARAITIRAITRDRERERDWGITCGRAIVACATHLFGQQSETAAVYIRSRQIDFPRIQVVFFYL